LYGRRLVLEWAEDEDSVDALRKRTAEHFHDSILCEQICLSFSILSSVCVLTITDNKLSKASDKCLNFSSAPKTAKKKKDILDDLLDTEMPE